jgi:hypothetical protein
VSLLAYNIHSKIIWEGWETTFLELFNSGWEITSIPKYENWMNPKDSARSHDKIYIRHPTYKTIGRITKDPAYDILIDESTYTLDFLSQECNKWVKPPRCIDERELTIDDVPRMMEIILNLQNANKPKKKPKPEILKQAEILLLKRA